jgi:hypothetical protein
VAAAVEQAVTTSTFQTLDIVQEGVQKALTGNPQFQAIQDQLHAQERTNELILATNELILALIAKTASAGDIGRAVGTSKALVA